MTTIKAFVTKHSVPAYFALTFAIRGQVYSWSSAGRAGSRARRHKATPCSRSLYLAMLVGPSVAGVLLTALVHGKAGLLEFRRRLVKWQVSARWYAVALLTAPLLATTYFLRCGCSLLSSSRESLRRATRRPSCSSVSR